MSYSRHGTGAENVVNYEMVIMFTHLWKFKVH